jgi:single-strand DNA-binding protein
MSNDLNQCSFIGRLGRDPETRHMPSGKAVVNFSIAVGSSWKDKQTGDRKEQTEWVNIVAFDKLGEICAEYLRKGSQVFIQGAMRTRKWQDKEGKDRYSTEIIASQMQMLGGKRDVESRPATESRSKDEPQRQAPADDGGFDDNIPFVWLIACVLGALCAASNFLGYTV